jgi:hypothetical protein
MRGGSTTMMSERRFNHVTMKQNSDGKKGPYNIENSANSFHSDTADYLRNLPRTRKKEKKGSFICQK